TDEIDQCAARRVTVRLMFLRRIDVLQTHVDIAPLRRAHQETVAVEDLAYRAGEIAIIGVCGRYREYAHTDDGYPSLNQHCSSVRRCFRHAPCAASAHRPRQQPPSAVPGPERPF